MDGISGSAAIPTPIGSVPIGMSADNAAIAQMFQAQQKQTMIWLAVGIGGAVIIAIVGYFAYQEFKKNMPGTKAREELNKLLSDIEKKTGANYDDIFDEVVKKFGW